MDFLLPYRPQLLSLLRIMTGLLILQHGTGKYLNFPVGPMNNASPLTAGGAAGLFELLGGALLALGLYTRLAAFVLSGTMAVAYFYAHAPRGFYPILNQGELAAALLLRLALPGGGGRRPVEPRPGVAARPCLTAGAGAIGLSIRPRRRRTACRARACRGKPCG
jgi:putative oxidoreductase